MPPKKPPNKAPKKYPTTMIRRMLVRAYTEGLRDAGFEGPPETVRAMARKSAGDILRDLAEMEKWFGGPKRRR